MAEALPYILAASAATAAGTGVYAATQAGKGGVPAPGVPAPGVPAPADVAGAVRQVAPRARAGLQARGIISSPYFEAQQIGEEAFGQFGGAGGGSLEDYLLQAQEFLGISQ